jgi:hypothetical protein
MRTAILTVTVLAMITVSANADIRIPRPFNTAQLDIMASFNDVGFKLISKDVQGSTAKFIVETSLPGGVGKLVMGLQGDGDLTVMRIEDAEINGAHLDKATREQFEQDFMAGWHFSELSDPQLPTPKPQ